MNLRVLPTSMPAENTAKLREIADWLIKQGSVMRVGDWIIDADFMCVRDAKNECYRGDVGGLIVTQFLRAMTPKELIESEYSARDVQAILINTCGMRGELFESFVNVDEILDDYGALHDKLSAADYGKTLTRYIDRAVRGEVSWLWKIIELEAG